nr:hypothetical protein [Tanacetum cinerariifolium]
MFLKYSTSQIPPNKGRDKGSQGKKTTDTPTADVDVSEESDCKQTKKRTVSRRVAKKKFIIYAADNIIPNLDVALEFGKSISLTEAVEEEATRKVDATHVRIMTKFKPKPAKRNTSSKKQKAVDIMQALKEIKKTNKRQPGTGTKPGVLDEKKVKSEENVILEWGSEQESEYSKEDQGDDEEVNWIDSDKDEEKKDDTDDDKSIDLEMTDDEETDDEFVHDEEKKDDTDDDKSIDLEMTDDEETDDEFVHEISDVTKEDAENIEEIKDYSKKAKLLPTSSVISVSSGFALIKDENAMDKEVVDTVKNHKRQLDDDDDDDDDDADPSAGPN